MKKRSPTVPSNSQDPVFDDFNRLNGLLNNLDDRGMVLSLASFAEEALGDLLKAFMLPNEASVQLIEGFNAPLGTFSARIKMVCALGLVTVEQFNDLERLRKIRNLIAHSWQPVELSDSLLDKSVAALNFSRLTAIFPETSRQKVRTSICCLLVELRSLTGQILANGKSITPVGANLFRGFPGDFRAQIDLACAELEEIKVFQSSDSTERRRFGRWLLKDLRTRLHFLPEPSSGFEAELVEELRNKVNKEFQHVGK